MTKLIVLGATGLLGSTLLKYFSKQSNIKCYGIIRKNSDIDKLKSIKNVKLYKIDYKNQNNIIKVRVIYSSFLRIIVSYYILYNYI